MNESLEAVAVPPTLWSEEIWQKSIKCNIMQVTRAESREDFYVFMDNGWFMFRRNCGHSRRWFKKVLIIWIILIAKFVYDSITLESGAISEMPLNLNWDYIRIVKMWLTYRATNWAWAVTHSGKPPLISTREMSHFCNFHEHCAGVLSV